MVTPEISTRIDQCVDYVLSNALGNGVSTRAGHNAYFYILMSASYVSSRKCEAWFCIDFKNYYFSNFGEFFPDILDQKQFYFDSGGSILAALKQYRNKEEEEW